MKVFRSGSGFWLLLLAGCDIAVQGKNSRTLPSAHNPTDRISITSDYQCVIERHSVYFFSESRIANDTLKAETAGACCEACREHGGVGATFGLGLQSSCNLWTWCPDEDGCSVDEVVRHPITNEPGRVRLQLGYQDCLLQYDKGSIRRLATASFYQNRNVTRPDIAFTSGAPITFASSEAPDAAGYQRFVGVELSRVYDWPCPGIPKELFNVSSAPQLLASSQGVSCWAKGSLEALLELCSFWPECDAVDFFPGGFSDNPDQPQDSPSGWLKSASATQRDIDMQAATMNPGAATFVKVLKPARHGLTLGALVGIACGCALLVVAAVSLGCHWWLRDRRRTEVPVPQDTNDGDRPRLKDKVGNVDDSASEWDPETGVQSYMPKKYSGASTGEISEPDTAYEGHSWASSGADLEVSLQRGLSQSAAMPSGRLEPADVEFELDDTGERRLLGQGTFGAVYLARWQGHTMVAIKTLRDAQPEEEAALLKEADMLQQLHHPNIVQFLGACRVPGQLMVATEYMARGTLTRAIAVDRSVPRRTGWYGRGRHIAMDIMRGIAFLHDNRIIHMDISSSNVLLDTGFKAKIADVGLSKKVLGESMQNTMRGTLAYMAIEMYDHEAPITYAADVYSFGVLLNEIVTGETPNKRRGLTMPRVPEDCPQAVVDLSISCMRAEPTERPTSWQVLDALEAIIGGNAVES